VSSTDFSSTTGGAASGVAEGSVSGSVREMASTAMDTVSRDAKAAASSAQDKATHALEQQTQAVGGTIGDFASAIRKAGEDLSRSDQTMAGQVVRQAADGLEHLSRSLADKRPHEILDAARDFGRRNPVAFAAGAMLLGVALGRLARSTGADGGDPTSPGGSSLGAAWPTGSGVSMGGTARQGGAPVYGEAGFTAASDYSTTGGSAPQEVMAPTDAAIDPVDPILGVPR
jgi:hypothetical protein